MNYSAAAVLKKKRTNKKKADKDGMEKMHDAQWPTRKGYNGHKKISVGRSFVSYCALPTTIIMNISFKTAIVSKVSASQRGHNDSQSLAEGGLYTEDIKYLTARRCNAGVASLECLTLNS